MRATWPLASELVTRAISRDSDDGSPTTYTYPPAPCSYLLRNLTLILRRQRKALLWRLIRTGHRDIHILSARHRLMERPHRQSARRRRMGRPHHHVRMCSIQGGRPLPDMF